jgi:uncharacterized protein
MTLTSRSVLNVHTSRIFAAALLALLLTACGGGGGGDSVSTEPSPPPPPLPTPSIVVALPTCSTVVSASAPLTSITSVQGTSSISPLQSQTVTVRGVVTGAFQNSTMPTTVTQLGGFFIQQPVPDNDPLTSEGIFVFAPSAAIVKPGDYVQVEGRVTEFGAVPNSVTQIAGTVTVNICGNSVVLEPTPLNLPLTAAADLEKYEGMLVQFPQTLAVTELFELGRYGRVALSVGGRQFHPNNGNAVVTAEQNQLARIVLDDNTTAQNPSPIPTLGTSAAPQVRRVGDTVQNLTGVLNYTLGNSGVGSNSIHAVAPPNFVAANPRQAAPPTTTGGLKVASFNVLNYFTTLGARGANTAAEFTRQQAKIVEAIAGLDADVLGLMEIENNSDVATQNLVAALNARVGAGTYVAVNSGTFGTDQIKVDILYKPSKVKRIGGVVLPTGPDLTNYTAVSGRPPLAQRFASVANNGGFWFVVNHFKSKGSCPTTGDVELGQGCWNVGRTGQATALSSFVDKLKAQGETDVLMMGDFNSYLNEDPTKVLETAGFESLLKRMPANDRYTYVFSGETGALDHGYASASMKLQVTSVGVWHINADEPPVIDYNTEFKPDDRYAANAYRASDHDPVILGITLNRDAPATQPILSATIAPAGQAGVAYGITVTEALASGSATLAQLSVDWGDGSSNTLTTVTTPQSITHSYNAKGSYTVTISLLDSSSQLATVTSIASIAAAPLVATTRDLFFSEYLEGTSNNKALEIYNPTPQTIDLSIYSVKLYTNGTTTVSNQLTLSGILNAGDALVIVNSGLTLTFSAPLVFTSSVALFSGDDAITLEKSGAVIDRIGQVGFRPAAPAAWIGAGLSTLDQTLRRKNTITGGDPNSAAVFSVADQWEAAPAPVLNNASGLGVHSVVP